MELEVNGLHTHESDGGVVILSIHGVYDSYNSESDEGDRVDTIVTYTDLWDAYGPMPSAVHTESLEEFTASVSEQRRTVEFEDYASE